MRLWGICARIPLRLTTVWPDVDDEWRIHAPHLTNKNLAVTPVDFSHFGSVGSESLRRNVSSRYQDLAYPPHNAPPDVVHISDLYSRKQTIAGWWKTYCSTVSAITSFARNWMDSRATTDGGELARMESLDYL